MSRAFPKVRLLSALTVGVAVMASACGGGTSPSGAAQDGNGQDGNNQGDSEFGLPEAEIVARVDAVEQSIATCMTEAGFEYVPVDYATARQAMDSDSKPSGLDPDQFRKEYGYGVTTLYGGADTQATLGLGRNVAIRDGQPAEARVAWERELFGDNANQTFVVGLDNEDLSHTGGCTRQAVEENFSTAELGPGFVNYQNADGSRVDQDARVIAAYRDWDGCMREAGYTYDTSADIDADLATRLDAITAGAAVEDLDATAQQQLTDLQGEERAIASADFDCEQAHVSDIKKTVEAEILGPNANP